MMKSIFIFSFFFSFIEKERITPAYASTVQMFPWTCTSQEEKERKNKKKNTDGEKQKMIQ